MFNLPKNIYSGEYSSGGHVQGIAVDAAHGFVYYSFTTMLLKTDLFGDPLGSVIRLAGHLGCITYDAENNKVYGSLELKHDAIGQGIINKTGWDPSDEDSFYLVEFDCAAICEMNMDAESDGVMRAIYLCDVVKDYSQIDEVSKKKHRYGCSGIDGTGLGVPFGATDAKKKIMVAYGIYSDVDRQDNDYQIILQYDRDDFNRYAKPLNQQNPHKSGPEQYEEKYFFYTGNTTYGVQNLEYDEYSGNWFLAVYCGIKKEFENFPLFFIDGKKAPFGKELLGREAERGLVLASAQLGECGKQDGIYGSRFPHGSTGMAAIGDGTFYFAHSGANKDNGKFYTNLVKYRYSPNNEALFEKEE